MRLWPFPRAQAAAKKTPKPDEPKGASGTINQDGFLFTSEYNRELRWPEGLQVWDRMLRSDASVREAYMHTVAPILNANPDIEAASEDPVDLEIAAFVRSAYFDWCDTPFASTLALSLKYLAWGYQLFELVEKVVEAEVTFEDPESGDEVTLPSRQFVAWDRWAHRKPDTVIEWHVHAGRLQRVVQFAMRDGSFDRLSIDADRLALFVNEQEGDDFTGLSILRPAHKAWWIKELVEKVMAMSVERHGLGINTAYVPESAKDDDATVDRIEEMLASLRAGDANYLVFPGPKQGGGAGSDGYLFEINTPQGGLPDFTGPLTYLRGEIKGTMLARFSELGHGNTGARATSDTQSEVWYDALHAVAAYVCGVHNDAIRRLVVKNYAGVEKFPKLVLRDIEARSLTEFADANAKLVASGAVLPDKPYRDYVRKGIDAPEESDDAVEQLADEAGLMTEPLVDATPPPGEPAPPKPADAGGAP